MTAFAAPAEFKLERYFALWEFKARYLLSASDCEPLALGEVLALADPAERERWERLSLGYTDSQGDPELRQVIAGLYTAAQPDDVLVAVPEEGIFLALHTLLEPGDHVVAVAPAYQSLHELVRARGCGLSAWPARLDEATGGWRFDLDELAGLITPRTRLLIINFPHNPTGHLLGLEELQAVVALARGRGLWLFSDEMYRGLEHDPAARLPAVADLYERGISLSGLSKTYSLPGLRLGWLAARQHGLVARWLALKDYTTICNSAPSEALGRIALRAGDWIIERNLGLIRANLDAARAFCARYPEFFEWHAPRAGSIAFPAWTGPGTAEAFCRRCWRRKA
jgi:aspartate/methionine/tyrosine aminotransferase